MGFFGVPILRVQLRYFAVTCFFVLSLFSNGLCQETSRREIIEIYNKGILLFNEGQYQSAYSNFIKVSNDSEDPVISGMAHFFCGLCLEKQRTDPERILSHFAQFIDYSSLFTPQTEDSLKQEILHALEISVDYSDRLGRYRLATEKLDRLINFKKKYSDVQDTTFCYLLLSKAVLLSKLKKIHDCLEVLDSLGTRCSQIKDARVHDQYAGLLADMEKFQNTSPTILTNSTTLRRQVSSDFRESVISLYQNSPREAIWLLKEKLINESASLEERSKCDLYSILGDFHYGAGDFKSALAAYDSSICYGYKTYQFPQLFRDLTVYGAILLLEDQTNQALDSLEKAISIRNQMDFEPELNWFLDFYLAKCHERKKQFFQADSFYADAIRQIEGQRAVLSNKWKTDFWLNKIDIYYAYIDFLVDAVKDSTRALVIADLAKSRQFVDLLMANLQNINFEPISGALSSPTMPSLEFTKKVEQDLMGILKEFLSPDMSIVYYFQTASRLHIWTIRTDSIFYEAQRYDENTVKIAATTFMRDVAQKSPSANKRSVEFYRKLWPKQTYKSRFVYISPHRWLHYLPFSSLYDGTQYLIEKFSLMRIPNLATLKIQQAFHLQEQDGLAKPNVVFAKSKFQKFMNLDYAEKEANEIASKLPNVEKYLNESATRDRFLQLKEFNILHLATHAKFDAQNPMRTGLVFAEGGKESNLSILEITQTKCKGNLIVLSACETALGKLFSGDEIVSLSRAFLQSGVKSVLASLWKVDDQATFFVMKYFYKALAGGLSVAEALRTAQLALLKPGHDETTAGGGVDFSHPYYWSGFTITGLNVRPFGNDPN